MVLNLLIINLVYIYCVTTYTKSLGIEFLIKKQEQSIGEVTIQHTHTHTLTQILSISWISNSLFFFHGSSRQRNGISEPQLMHVISSNQITSSSVPVSA